jgi:hypothetical protein
MPIATTGMKWEQRDAPAREPWKQPCAERWFSSEKIERQPSIRKCVNHGDSLVSGRTQEARWQNLGWYWRTPTHDQGMHVSGMRALFAIPRRTDIQFHQFRRGLESLGRRQDASECECGHRNITWRMLESMHACRIFPSARMPCLLWPATRDRTSPTACTRASLVCLEKFASAIMLMHRSVRRRRSAGKPCAFRCTN